MFVVCSCVVANMFVLSECFLFVIVASQTCMSCTNVYRLYFVCNMCVPYKKLSVCCYIVANMCVLLCLFVVCFCVLTNMCLV